MSQQIALLDLLFLVLYGGVTLTAVIACCYLLFRRSNAFVPEVTPPLRLRRWAAAFFASMAASHVWWLLLYFEHPDGYSSDRAVICLAFDILTDLPTILCTMLVMLQDRRRPLWPIAVVVVICLANLLLFAYAGINIPVGYVFLVMLLIISVLMVLAVRNYGRWLRDNYADLEHKEVWLSFVVLAAFMLNTVFYNISDGNVVNEMVIQAMDIVLIFILLWRVERLQTLLEPTAESLETSASIDPIFNKIEMLLEQHCVNKQFYLKQDVSVSQLARLIGTNRTYLSQYFAQQGMTYNTYINNLRIQNFIRLYQEAVAEHRIFTASELANESGFRSYSTFSSAFKQVMGQTVTAWIRDHEE